MTHKTINQQYDVRYIEWENPQYTKGHTPSLDDLATLINTTAPQVVGFSMNIWNREACRQLAHKIKSKHPNCCILVGGQETTNSVIDYLSTIPEFDYLIDGEGERPFIEFLQALDPTSNRIPTPEHVSGMHYRSATGTTFTGRAHVLENLDDNPSIILSNMAPVREKDRLGILLESTRGCPFQCGFCFEGAKREKLRSASVARLSQEIDHMVAQGTRYFHVMDPILCNSNLDRLADLAAQFKRIRQQHGHLSISVETYADQITEQIAGYLQEFTVLDIGLQSINPDTLQAIRRKFDKPKFIAGVKHVNKAGTTTNIYLILGLPFETAATFLDGVLFALNCRPTQVFINELLLLNGTDLRRRATEYGYDFDPNPPYTVFANKWLATDQVNYLKTVAKNIEHRYNLNNRNFASPTPWRPTENHDDFQFHKTLLECRCTLACQGCKRAAPPQDKTPAAGPSPELSYDAAQNANIELTCGEDIPIATIVQTAAQYKLAGALRIKLSAPAALFDQPQAIEQLIHAGVYYFKTFLPGEGQSQLPAVEKTLQYFKNIRYHKIQISGRKLSPHVEICINDRFQSLDEQLDTAVELGADYANLVSIASMAEENKTTHELSEEHRQSWVRLITASQQHHFAVKPPRAAAKALFTGNDDTQRILTSLDQMKMIHKENKPPCWAPPSI